MSFPLIREPAPLQQLADVLGGIAQRRQAVAQTAFEREQALSDEARRNRYLTLNQQQADDTRTHQQSLERNAAQQLALQTAQFNATLDAQRIAVQERDMARKRQALIDITGMLPAQLRDRLLVDPAVRRQILSGAQNKQFMGPGVTPEAARANAAMTQAETPNITDLAMRSQAAGSPAVQGSRLQPARNVTVGGVTYLQPTENYNAPAAGAQGGGGTPAERVAGVQADNVERSIANMERIAREHPRDAQTALAIIHGQELHGKVGSAINFLRGTPSQGAQDFISEWGNFQLATTPLYGGSRPTVQLLGLERLASAPAIGADDFTIPFGHMRDRIRELRAKAGQQATPTGPAIDPRFLPGRRR